MQTIIEIQKRYYQKIALLDLELLICYALKKSKEFILTYPEYPVTDSQALAISELAKRRMKGEPIAYLVGHKEFFGLDFLVNSHTLVPRPETEMLVEQALHETYSMEHEARDTYIVDVGTGSGCIITAIASTMEHGTWSMEQKKCLRYYATDISKEALKVAKKNAKLHSIEKKIKFLNGNLLEPLFHDSCSMFHVPYSMIIIANLPYLSKEIYQSAPRDVKKYEPKTALFSSENGLAHYHELLKQINQNFAPCSMLHVSCFLEISPEQKLPLTKIVKTIFPTAKIEFKKDLAGKWRLCKIKIK
ncbi:MAG: peptide chain release factor N(5)-glutamine methyltransferase [Candidatus Moraniibacteriota bacterium]